MSAKVAAFRADLAAVPHAGDATPLRKYLRVPPGCEAETQQLLEKLQYKPGRKGPQAPWKAAAIRDAREMIARGIARKAAVHEAALRHGYITSQMGADAAAKRLETLERYIRQA